MDHKAVETMHNISNEFGPGTANRCTVQWWFKKFCKGDTCLEDEEHSDWPLEVDKNQLRAIIEVDHLTATKEVVQELIINSSIHHMKQIGKVEKLIVVAS